MLSLIAAGVCFTIISALLVRRWLPIRYSFPVLILKFSFPLLYARATKESQALFYSSRDDFYTVAQSLLAEGHTPLSLLLDGFEPIVATGTTDPFYYWWNAFWLDIIGNTIHAPILANVFVTVIGSIFSAALVSRLGYSFRYQRLFLVFVLFHWEILSWSSVINHKDPLMATLTVVGIYLIVVALQTSNTSVLIGSITLLSCVLWTISYIRWYIPGVFLATLMLWIFLDFVSTDYRYKPHLVISSGILGLGILWFLLTNVDLSHYINPEHIPIGAYRYTLGPTPGGASPAYAYLNAPAAFHWLFAPLALISVILFSTKRFERIILLYGLVLVCIYAGTEGASGPRFRFQFVFFAALLQFHGLWFLINRKYQIKVRASSYVGIPRD